MEKIPLSTFKDLNTWEYAVDIEEVEGNRYEIKSYKLSFGVHSTGAFYFWKNNGVFNGLNEVYDFIKDYRLGPTDFITELTFKRYDINKALTKEQKVFLNRLEILSRTSNIRQIIIS